MPVQDNTDYVVGDFVVTKDDRSQNTFWVIQSRKLKVPVPEYLSGKYTNKSAALKALGAYEEVTMKRNVHEHDSHIHGEEEDLSD